MTTHLMSGSGTGSLALCGGTVLPGDKLQSNLEETTCLKCAELASFDRYEICLTDGQSKHKQVGGSHYAEQEIQPWDVMKSMQDANPERFSPFQWHLIFTALKYLMRLGRKGPPLDDINKMIHYLEKLRETL